MSLDALLSVVCRRALALHACGKTDLAITCCNRALANNPQDGEVLTLLTYLHSEIENFEQAIHYGQKTLQQNAQTAFVWALLGKCFHERGAHEEARRAYENAFCESPSSQHACGLLTATQLALGPEATRLVWSRIKAAFNPTPNIFFTYLALMMESEGQSWVQDQLAHSPLTLPPLDSYKLESVQAWAKKRGWPVRSLGNVETIPVPALAALGPEGYQQEAFEPRMLQGYAAPYLADLSDVKVISQCNAVLTDEGMALNDLVTLPPHGPRVTLEWERGVEGHHGRTLFMRSNACDICEMESGFFLAGRSSSEFGHWAPEYMMRLRWFEQHPQFSNTPLVVDGAMPQSHFDWLRHITHQPMIILDHKKYVFYRFKTLIVSSLSAFCPIYFVGLSTDPGPTGAMACVVSPEGLRFLRERTLASVPERPSPSGEKLYITRRGSSWRRLLNDPEISTFLENQGFTTVAPEKMTFAEQVSLFRNARVIVAPDGSALNNLMFAPTDVRVAILTARLSRKWHNVYRAWYGAFQTLGCRLLFVFGDTVAPHKHADYEVPVDRVKQALAILGS